MSNETSTNITSATTQLAAQMDPTFGFSGPVIVNAVGGSSDQARSFALANFVESASALSGTVVQSLSGAAIAGALTGNPLVAGLVGSGIALNKVFGGGKGRGE